MFFRFICSLYQELMVCDKQVIESNCHKDAAGLFAHLRRAEVPSQALGKTCRDISSKPRTTTKPAYIGSSSASSYMVSTGMFLTSTFMNLLLWTCVDVYKMCVMCHQFVWTTGTSTESVLISLGFEYDIITICVLHHQTVSSVCKETYHPQSVIAMCCCFRHHRCALIF